VVADMSPQVQALSLEYTPPPSTVPPARL